jgi:predicted RNA binding protein YcfA (HicA-like mRNA interferase family)
MFMENFLKVLETHDWKLISVKGSHHKYRKNNKTVVVPVHSNRDLGSGLLSHLLQQTNLAESDL